MLNIYMHSLNFILLNSIQFYLLPVHVNEGKLVDKEILCTPKNFPLAYYMHAGNLEAKGKISLLHEQ